MTIKLSTKESAAAAILTTIAVVSQMRDDRRGAKHGTIMLHRFKDRHQRLETKHNLTPATEMGQEVLVAALHAKC